MRKKGFTLIELLAVLVILAVIALISVPIIIGVIQKSKKGAFEDSAYGIIDSIRLYYAEHSTEDEVEETFDFTADTKLKVNGKKPKLGYAILKDDGKIAIAVSDGKWCALKGFDEEKISVIDYQEKTCKIKGIVGFQDGTPIYYNPNTNTKCQKEQYAGHTIDTKSGCMKWHIFLDNGVSDTVNMILDHNIGINVNADTIDVLETELRNRISGWQVVPRIMSADDIAKITGAIDANVWPPNHLNYFKRNDIVYYLDGARGTDPNWKTQVANASNKSNYIWLFDYSIHCVRFGCNEEVNEFHSVPGQGQKDLAGFWAYSTMNIPQGSERSHYIYRVSNEGNLKGGVSGDALAGLRPVIRVSRDIIS